jgi:hypothetical protein
MTAEIDRRLGLQRARQHAAVDGVRRRRPHRRHDDLHERRRGQPARRDRQHLVRRAAQRSPLNTQCKRLLLGHAFDTLGCIAVEFRTHRLNTQSRRAIERLGAQLDGILRAHQVSPNGTLRDTAVYSITAGVARRCAPTWTGSWPSRAEPGAASAANPPARPLT